MSYEKNKQDCLNLLKATHAGTWDKMSKKEKSVIYKDHMVLREAIGKRTWANPYGDK